jgi:peptide/nickel transport system ATP-binding protein
VRIAGKCEREAPPRRDLGGGKEILCHHTRAELEALQSS